MVPILRRLLGTKPRYLLAVDIGSNTIRSFLFEQAGGGYIALARHAVELPPREREADLIPFIANELRDVLVRTARRIGRAPSAVLIGLSSRFAFNETTTVHRRRERPDALVRVEEIAAMLSAFRRERAERASGTKHYHLACVSPLRVLVDGYTADALTGTTRGRTIELVLFATYALAPYWTSLLGLRALWGGMELNVMADQAAIAAALISGLGEHAALLVTIGARATEVSLIDRDIIRMNGRFDLGGEAVTQAIAGAMGISRRDAERIKRQWGRAILPPRAARTAAAAISGAAGAWLEDLVRFLESGHCAVPERIYLAGGGAGLDALREALASPAWHRELAEGERVRVIALAAEQFAGSLFRNSRPALAGPEETGLAALVHRLAAHHS